MTWSLCRGVCANIVAQHLLSHVDRLPAMRGMCNSRAGGLRLFNSIEEISPQLFVQAAEGLLC